MELAGGLFTTVGLLVVGSWLLLKRSLVANALNESNKVFWRKVGLPVGDSGDLLNRVVLPTFGLIFIVAGTFSIYRFVTTLRR